MRRSVWVILSIVVFAFVAEAQTTIFWKRDTIYAGHGGAIATVTPPNSDATNPTTPSGLATTGKTATSVSLSWTGSSDSGGSALAGYKVFRQKGSGASLPVGTVNSSTTAFTDQPLEASTSYTYRIRAFDNGQNHSNTSGGLTVTTFAATTDTTAPSAPLQATGQVLGSSSVKINWLAATDAGGAGVAGYRVKRGTTDVSGWLAASARTFTDNTAPQNTTSSYTVDAKDGQANISTASNTVNVTTPLESIPPSTPGSPSASGLTSTSIRVSWGVSTDGGGSGLSGYRVYRAGNLISGTNPITGTTFDETGLAPNTTYTNYTIKAIDGAGNLSAAAGPVNGTSLPDTIAPTQPGNFDVEIFGGEMPWVSWGWTQSTDSGGSGLAGYKLYFVAGGEFLVAETGDTTGWIGTDGWNWENYTGFRVYAVDGAGNLSTPANAQ